MFFLSLNGCINCCNITILIKGHIYGIKHFLDCGREKMSLGNDRVFFSRSQKNIQLGMSSQRRLRSACTSTQSDNSLHCPYKHTLVPWLPMERLARHWSDGADAQDNLSLLWGHIPSWTFCYALAPSTLVQHAHIFFITFDFGT